MKYLIIVLVCLTQTPLCFAEGIEKEKIQSVMQENVSKFHSCYSNHLKIESKAYGKALFNWAINKEGKVINAKVDIAKTLKNTPDLEKCFLDTLSALKFPKPVNAKEVTVLYPMIFNNN